MRKKSRQMPQNLEGFLAHTISETGPKSVIDSLAFLTGSFVISLKGRIVEFNEAFVRLIGYEPEELHGMSVFDLVHPEERASVERRLANSTTGQYKVKLFTKSGQTKYTLAAPCHFNVLGKVYRLTQLIDNTDYVNQYRQHLINLRGTAQALTRAIEQRDSYTTGHMSRVARIALKIGQMLLLEESLLEDLIIGSSIHDIGKIAVPIEILAKPGKLEEHEWAYIRR
ncbi:MAG: PAS domain S-box protein, partial [Pseudohongiellaceae bacterium]